MDSIWVNGVGSVSWYLFRTPARLRQTAAKAVIRNGTSVNKVGRLGAQSEEGGQMIRVIARRPTSKTRIAWTRRTIVLPPEGPFNGLVTLA